MCSLQMAQVCKNLCTGVRIVTAHSLHKYLGISYFHGNYWSFQKNAEVLIADASDSSPDRHFLRVTDRTEGLSHKGLEEVSSRIKSLALNPGFVGHWK